MDRTVSHDKDAAQGRSGLSGQGRLSVSERLYETLEEEEAFPGSDQPTPKATFRILAVALLRGFAARRAAQTEVVMGPRALDLPVSSAAPPPVLSSFHPEEDIFGAE